MLGLRSIRWVMACGTVWLCVASAALGQTEDRVCEQRTVGAGLSVSSLLVPVDGALKFRWQCDGRCTAERVEASAGGGCQLNRGRRSGVGAFLASLLLLGLAARKRTS